MVDCRQYLTCHRITFKKKTTLSQKLMKNEQGMTELRRGEKRPVLVAALPARTDPHNGLVSTFTIHNKPQKTMLLTLFVCHSC